MAHESGSPLDRDLVQGVPTDQEMEVQLKDSLAWTERLDAQRTYVRVRNGVATLTGEVRSDEEWELAESTARSVRGITDVVNRLKVTGYGRKSA